MIAQWSCTDCHLLYDNIVAQWQHSSTVTASAPHTQIPLHTSDWGLSELQIVIHHMSFSDQFQYTAKQSAIQLYKFTVHFHHQSHWQSAINSTTVHRKFWRGKTLVNLVNYAPKISLPIFTGTLKMCLTYALTLMYSLNLSSPITFTCMVHQNFPMYGTFNKQLTIFIYILWVLLI